MKIGLIARADNRGIGQTTWEFQRHMSPHRTLLIDGSVISSAFTQHLDRYPASSTIVHRYDHSGIPLATQREFLDGLDVVYLVETPYDYTLYETARAMGVRTVCHVNPEFYLHATNITLPHPDVVWLPTTWHAEKIKHARIIPAPVARDRLPLRHITQANQFLHIIGQRAMRDRNGTLLLLRALRYVQTKVSIIMRSQSNIPRSSFPRNVTLDVRVGDTQDYAELYAEGDVMLLPRRYGGNCLVLHEALASGIPTMMPNCAPQNRMLAPDMLMPGRTGPPLRTQLGMIPTFDADPRRLASAIDRLTREPETVQRWSQWADECAESLSWTKLAPVYTEALEQACA
jgi:glycosyltransferase involved in cell wall biosynthesis